MGYKCFDLTTNKLYISRYVFFDESSFPFHQMVSNPFFYHQFNHILSFSFHISSHITLSSVTSHEINNDKHLLYHHVLLSHYQHHLSRFIFTNIIYQCSSHTNQIKIWNFHLHCH